jgi:hypothetical protein
MIYRCTMCGWAFTVGVTHDRVPPWCGHCGVDFKTAPPVAFPVEKPVAEAISWGQLATAAEGGSARHSDPPVPETAPLPVTKPGAAPDWSPALTLMTLGGLALVVVAVFLGWRVRTFMTDADTTTGVVATVWKPEALVSGVVRQQTVIQYRVNGTDCELPADDRPPGEKVSLVYPPSAPQDARVNATLALYQWPILVGGVGLVFLVGGVVVGGLVSERRSTDDS